MEKVVVDGLARLPAFSHAVVAGDTIYVSGSLGTLPDSMTLATGGTGPETTQTLKNVEMILQGCGASLADVVKVNVFVSDMATFNEMNDAYLEVFGESPPARTTVGGVDLALGAAIEIDCIAHRPS
ncbi:MAG TPA: RidA family protein [Acidimicrobiia bacterium]|jgi:2-iminobutanoate/2-iminopropanoate deaminase